MKRSLALIAALLLAGCAIFGDPTEFDETKSWSVQRIYAEAQQKTRTGDYDVALDYLGKIESRYPHGRYATQAQLDALEARLSELVIHAPFDGVLGLRQVSNGAYLASGTELTTLDDISKIRVEFNVAERYLAALQTDMPVSADNIAYVGHLFHGKVKAIDPRIDPVTRSVKVHAVIDNADLKLRPGMLLNVHVELAKTAVVQIPEKAVMPLQSKHYVFVVEADDKVRQVEIIPGQRLPGLVEVVSGLKAGDEIVTQGSQKLRSGVVITRAEQ